MDRALSEWLVGGDSGVTQSEGAALRTLKLPYTIYGCMLLLSSSVFEGPRWLEEAYDRPPEDFEKLYRLITKYLKVTHIAINKPIPAREEDGGSHNVLRAPINLNPLYGDFGPTTCSSPPCQQDFDSAFWVAAKQNGIVQSWAPRWTMFSRGNISEKARLISLPSVERAVEDGKASGSGCTAVDLYAGIGYFAFSYMKAGFSKVLCWDLNPWSLEGLRRGAAANKWTTTTPHSPCSQLKYLPQFDIYIFNESNENATKRMQDIRHKFPPIRHVNCGLLPTSRGSWQTAVDILDTDLGGWIHVHENFALQEIDRKVEDLHGLIQDIATKTREATNIEIEHVSRLKSYAPGVMHCVVDIYIPPRELG